MSATQLAEQILRFTRENKLPASSYPRGWSTQGYIFKL